MLKTNGAHLCAYIPPHKLKMMAEGINDKSSDVYQQIAWQALKKSIHGLINKVGVSNIDIIVKNLFKENIIRGQGLLCRSLLQAQAASLKFSNVYAALIAVVNSKFPKVGELLAIRCIKQFKSSYRKEDKSTCLAAVIFIAHLYNQRVVHEIVLLDILGVSLEKPTNYSVEIVIELLKECGDRLKESSQRVLCVVFDQLRGILSDGILDTRVLYMIEVIFQVRKDKFKDYPALIEELDLIKKDDQITHSIRLNGHLDGQGILDVFRSDPDYLENENKYRSLCKKILGDESKDDGDLQRYRKGLTELNIHTTSFHTDYLHLMKHLSVAHNAGEGSDDSDKEKRPDQDKAT